MLQSISLPFSVVFLLMFWSFIYLFVSSVTSVELGHYLNVSLASLNLLYHFSSFFFLLPAKTRHDPRGSVLGVDDAPVSNTCLSFSLHKCWGHTICLRPVSVEHCCMWNLCLTMQVILFQRIVPSACVCLSFSSYKCQGNTIYAVQAGDQYSFSQYQLNIFAFSSCK